jgi:hypothetical protein
MQHQRDSRSRPQVQWGVTWKIPALMLGFYCAALILGLGHHLFYTFLDGKPAEDQSVSLIPSNYQLFSED